MSISKNIGFIGGGRMGEALIKGILQANLVKTEQIQVMEPDNKRRAYLSEQYGIAVYDLPESVWINCDIVLLAVKPQIMEQVLTENKQMMSKNHLLISIAAGITIGFIEQHTPKGSRIIRVMPNTPALVLEAASALSCGINASSSDIEETTAIFEAIGKVVILEEHLLDAVTGLSGSGPAYVFTFLEALIDAGLRVGLSRPVAETLVYQTVLGATKLAIESGDHPAQLRSMVTSPGGTTIAGLHELESAGFNGIVMDAVEAATKRSMELGK